MNCYRPSRSTIVGKVLTIFRLDHCTACLDGGSEPIRRDEAVLGMPAFQTLRPNLVKKVEFHHPNPLN